MVEMETWKFGEVDLIKQNYLREYLLTIPLKLLL